MFFVFLFFVHIGTNGRHGRQRRQRRPLDVKPDTGQPTLFTFHVVNEFNHDPGAFTQGLQFDERCDAKGRCKEVFWESTGLNGRSSVREVELATGKVLRVKSLPKDDFGEGLTRLGDRLYQVTWRSGKAWSYGVDDFEDVEELEVSGSRGARCGTGGGR